MNIQKLPSGSYRISKMVQGKRYSLTVPFKPNKHVAEELINEKIYGGEIPFEDSVLELANLYINTLIKENKSPTTINGYKSIIKNTPEWFLDLKPTEISVSQYQRMINEYSANHSPKSTYNLNGFYKCVFADISHIKSSTIKLPKREKRAEYEPSTQDIREILDYFKGTRYDCAINLACIGLRRGETCAITSADLKGTILTINKDLVYTGNGYIIKDHPKTFASNRRINIPEHIANMIMEQGVAYSGSPHSINRALHSAQEKLGIPQFRLHILRHYAAACLHKNGFTDRQIMAYMGWETASTMQQVYNYNLDPEETQKDIADVFSCVIRV